MKCPLVVSNSWKSAADNQIVSKVVVSLDPLRPEDPSSLQDKKKAAPVKVSDVKRTRRTVGNWKISCLSFSKDNLIGL